MKTLPVLREGNGRIIRLNSLISFTEEFFVHWPSDIISFLTHTHTHTQFVCVKGKGRIFFKITLYIYPYMYFLLNASWLSL